MNQDRSDRHRWTRIVVGAGLFAVVLWAHHYLPSNASALAAQAIRSLHAPGFGLVSLAVLKLGQFSGGPVARYSKAAALSMLIAVIAEAAQIPGGREAQLIDVVIDALGIIGFLGCAAALDRNIRARIGVTGAIALAIFGIPAFAAAVAPTVQLTYALVMRQQSLPVLLTFDGAWERTFARNDDADFEVIPAPEGWPPGSGNIARVESAGRFAFMLRLAPYPDWSDYVAVSFVAATTDGESRRIELGLWGLEPGDGSLAGRYYTGVRIGPLPARYCIRFADLPDATSDRPFDLEIVSELLLAAARHEKGIRVLVDDFRLEQSAEVCSNK